LTYAVLHLRLYAAFSGVVFAQRAGVQLRPEQAKHALADLTYAAIQPHVALVCRY